MTHQNEIVVALSGINANDNPGAGIGIAKSLRKDKSIKVKIIGLAYDAMETGIYMDWLFDKSYLMPYPSGNYEGFLQRLYWIKEKEGLDFIFPSLDSELPLFIKYQHEIEAAGIKMYLPSSDQFLLRNKQHLKSIAEKMEITTPTMEVIANYDALMQTVDQIKCPIMVKGTLCEAFCAYTVEEVIKYYHHIAAKWGLPVILQEIASGSEMNLLAVGDGEGGSLGFVCVKKMTTTSLGKIWVGVTIKNERMFTALHRFLQFSRWKGPLEVECIVNEKEVSLIEINPRFPAWTYLAAGMEINLPGNILRHVFKKNSVVVPDYEAGKLYIRYTDEMVLDIDPFQEVVTKGEL